MRRGWLAAGACVLGAVVAATAGCDGRTLDYYGRAAEPPREVTDPTEDLVAQTLAQVQKAYSATPNATTAQARVARLQQQIQQLAQQQIRAVRRARSGILQQFFDSGRGSRNRTRRQTGQTEFESLAEARTYIDENVKSIIGRFRSPQRRSLLQRLGWFPGEIEVRVGGEPVRTRVDVKFATDGSSAEPTVTIDFLDRLKVDLDG